MLRSTFASFTTAQLAIRATQNSLAIVGQNIANVNTSGYTRQRIDQVSLNTKNATSLYASSPQARIGYGVEVLGVNQIRDPFLDVRYRMEMSNLGTEDKKLEILEKINGIMDEFGKDNAVDDQFSDFFKQLSTMASTKDSNDNLARSSAKTLTDMIRKYADQLTDVKENLETNTKGDVDDINDILGNIQKLNASIKKGQTHGNSSLELLDQRNLLIDELSTYVNINVTHSTDVTMVGAKVDVLKIDMIGENGENINLIDDINPAAQFEFQKPEDASEDYRITLTDSAGMKHEANSDKGVFKSALEMLNGNGEFDTPTTDRGVGYYQNCLDTMAQVFAETLNGLNTVTEDADGNPILDENGNPTQLGGALFGANDGSGEITAANICISDDWQSGDIRILTSRDPNAVSDDLSNVNNMINALTTNRIEFKTSDDADGTTLYNGTFQEYFTDIASTAASDYKATSAALDNYLSIASDISDSKDSVSGVNADEEYMNMIQFNNALTAASRLMTTLDEAIGTVINMGVVGR